MAVALIAIAACDGDNNLGDNIPPSAAPGDTTAVIGTNLVTFNRATPGTIATTRPITGLAMGETPVGGDFRPANGMYYIVTNQSRVYAVNTASGAVSMMQTLSTPLDTMATSFGVDFNPVPDRLRVTTNTGQNLRINVDAATANTTVDGPLMLAGVPVGADEVAYSNNFGNTCRTTLFYIDTTGDRLLTTALPNQGVVTAVGPLNVDASGASGFEIISTANAMGVITNSAIATLTVNGTTALYNINLSTGAATPVTGTLSGPAVGLSATPAAMGPANAVGEIVALNATANTMNNLISFNSGVPGKLCTTAPITGVAANEVLLDLDVRPANGLLYGLGSLGNIYTIAVDSMSATATMVSTLNPIGLDSTAGATFSIDFNPVPDRLRIVSSAGQNLRVNVDNGLVANGPTNTTVPGDDPINGGAGTSVTGVAYTNAIAGTVTTRLFDIDTGNDRLTIQNPPNNGTLVNVGALGLDAASAAGFDINGLTNQAFAGLNLTAGATATTLYTVNLATGAVTLATTPAGANAIGGGAPIRGFALSSAMTQASKATVVAVTSANQIVNFNPATPTTTSTPVAITGLPMGENIIGIDQRPNGRLLYAVTDANKLYTIALTFNAPVAPAIVGTIATATATVVGATGALTADPTDASAPFTALMGAQFGFDFNPVPDRLRITSDANQNLRINPTNGATITDGNLNGVMGATVVASAYINNFNGATATTLFDIDSTGGSLLVQNPPNDGTLALVGTGLGVGAFTNLAAFDIVGGDNTFSLAALELTPAGNGSSLFLVNTTAGTAAAQPSAAPANVIGGASPLTITAATIFLQ